MPDQWRWVPSEPTEEMLQAAFHAVTTRTLSIATGGVMLDLLAQRDQHRVKAKLRWAAMLAASPSPVQGGVEDGDLAEAAEWLSGPAHDALVGMAATSDVVEGINARIDRILDALSRPSVEVCENRSVEPSNDPHQADCPAGEDWAKLALGLNTYTDHNQGCGSYRYTPVIGGAQVDAGKCTCGLSDLSKRALEWAEALAPTTPEKL